MFQNRFEPALIRKVRPKRQTIRRWPKRMPKVGDRESWRVWTGLPYRSKTREVIRVRLTAVVPFAIAGNLAGPLLLVNHQLMPESEWNLLAKADGFPNYVDMVRWFAHEHGLPFRGILIRVVGHPGRPAKS
ncbi:MAG: ASCH domain-containing protein [Patescibacteria group bacterium]|nr:ASCH domain-containing protein [Patescibacteria group bacterium]